MHFLQLIALIGTLGPIAAQLELPDPRIVIVGPTGSGKSSLANALLGCDPRSNDCMFEVCPDLDSCTKQTSIGTGPWLGNGKNYTVVDTPGFGDSDGQDNDLIEEMMLVLDDSLGYSNTILLLFDGQTARFTTGLHNMLRQMSSLFGATWWEFMVIGVSKWKYSQDAIDDREENCHWYPDQCKDEAWFRREINGQLQDKFHLERNFSFAFIDSYSQSKPELDDQVQQEHYQAEAKILWDSATTRNSTFDFKTIDDVLEENARQKEEIKWLNDVITNNISHLMDITSSNTEAIEAANIRIDVEQDHIEAIEDKIEDLNLTPIGTIIAWITHVTDGNITYLPEGWVRCDGNVIMPPSIWAGKFTPNLNGEKRFLRGGTDRACLMMEEDQTRLIDHTHKIVDRGHKHNLNDPGHVHEGKDDGHTHTIKDHGHKHTLTDKGHKHTITDKGHKHPLTDPGHTHGYRHRDWGDEGNQNGGHGGQQMVYPNTQSAKTGITVNTATTGIDLHTATTGIVMDTGTTNIEINSGKSRIDIQKGSTGMSIVTSTSGITVGKVSSEYNDDTTTETRPKNMNVIYIIRVW